MVYLAWLFYIQWLHASLLLFDRLKLDPTKKVWPVEWKIKWVYLMAYQAKLIEEGSWRIFAEPFYWFHIHIKILQPNEDPHGNQMRIKEDSTRKLISRQNPCEIHVYLYGSQLIWGTLHYIQHLRWLKDRGKGWHLSPTKNSWQLIMLKGMAWLTQLKW